MSTTTIRALREAEEATLAARNAIWDVLMLSNPLVETCIPTYTGADVDAQTTEAVCANQDLAQVLEKVQYWRIHSQSANTVTIRVDALRALMSAWTQHSYSEYDAMDKEMRRLQQRVMDAEKRIKMVKAELEAETVATEHLVAELAAAKERATDAEQHIKEEEERFWETQRDWEDEKERHKWDKSVLKRNAEKSEERAASLKRNLIATAKRYSWPLESLKVDADLGKKRWIAAVDKRAQAEATLASLRKMGLDEVAESMRVAMVIYTNACAEEKAALETYTDAHNLVTLLNC